MNRIARRTAGNVQPQSRHVPLLNARSRHTVPVPVPIRGLHTPAIEALQARQQGMQGDSVTLQYAEHETGPWHQSIFDLPSRAALNWIRVILRGSISRPIRVDFSGDGNSAGHNTDIDDDRFIRFPAPNWT